jgi:hypothetical protein
MIPNELCKCGVSGALAFFGKWARKMIPKLDLKKTY